MKPDDVVGLDIIAQRCGVTKAAVRGWRSRFGDFPAARHLGDATAAGSAPWWDWSKVEAWLDKHPTLGNRT